MRRHLHLGWAEWRALPWYEQRAYREGILAEFSNVNVTRPMDEDDQLRAAGITVG